MNRAEARRRNRPTQRPFVQSFERLEPRHLLAQVGGTITDDTLWTASQSPYEVVQSVTVPPGVTLRIEPGVVLNFRDNTGLTVRGRLVAEGTPGERIRFDRASGSSRWKGIAFRSTRADSRITYADMNRGDDQGEAVLVDRSRVLLDNVVWTGTRGTILELDHPSLIVRNSQFPTSTGAEVVHGEHISGDEYLIIDGNVFANSNNGGDVIDFLGADRPGPVMQVLNNVFLGGGDDGLDLDGTDAHIEGNVFMNFRKNTGRNTTSNAIATGLPQTGEPNRTEITVVRNLFVNNDHALLLKEDAFAMVEHNVFVDSRLAVIQFNEVGGTAVKGAGKGAYLSGNILWNNARLFKNLIDQPTFRTDLRVDNSLLPNEPVNFGGTVLMSHELGSGNIEGNPRFVDPGANDFRLAADSPAIGRAPGGLDLGAMVPAGPLLDTDIDTVATGEEIVLSVYGPGMTSYRYRIDDGPWQREAPLDEPIRATLSDVGPRRVDVIARNSAGEWFAAVDPAFGKRTAQVIAPRTARAGESLPVVVRVRGWQGDMDTTFTDQLIVHHGAAQLPLSVEKGIAVAAVPVGREDGSITIPEMEGDAAYQVLQGPVQVVEHSGMVSADETWRKDTLHRITGTLTVPAGVALTWEAGTRLLVDPVVNLEIAGTLLADGMLSDPVWVSAWQSDMPWGGIEALGGTIDLRGTFLTNGGGDQTRTFGHSDSQPVLKVQDGSLACNECFVLDNPGKGFGSRNSRVQIVSSVLSRVDTGGEFSASVVDVRDTWLLNIPDGSTEFSDDDNDGFYFVGVHPSGEASRLQDSFVIRTKDDGLDHNGARLIVEGSWIEQADHEGIAASNSGFVQVHDSVFTANNQGIEAGYGAPDVRVTQSVLVANDNHTDAGSPITAGLRFGDGYDGRNGPYLGQITASELVLWDNDDNVRNWDGSIGGPKPGAIDIDHSLANDEDAPPEAGNTDGVPVFGRAMHLLRGSAGFSAGPQGLPVGRPPVITSRRIVVLPPADFNNDGRIDAADIDLLCAAIDARSAESVFDLNDDGAVDLGDQQTLVQDILRTTAGDANLDRRFDSKDLIAVFQRGEYEDSLAKNSTWADGDWNCDGEFDSSDLLLAFQQGGYAG